MLWPSRVLLGICVLGFLSGVAFSQGPDGVRPAPIRIDGSSTVFPISEAAARSYRKQHSDVRISVGVSGTGGGFRRFTAGETDISDASRPMKPAEIKACRDSGVEFIELPVALDSLAFVVNPENDWVKELSIEQLRRIFVDVDDKPRTWADVNQDWPDVPLKLFIPGTDSGAFDYMKEVLIGRRDFNIRSDVSASEDDNVLVVGVASEKGALAFFGTAYYWNNQQKLKAVRITDPENMRSALPTAEKITDGKYPFGRPLFIYVNKESLQRAEVEQFAKFYLNHAEQIAGDVGYVPLNMNIMGKVRKRFQMQVTGTAFLTDQGKRREGSLMEIYGNRKR